MKKLYWTTCFGRYKSTSSEHHSAESIEAIKANQPHRKGIRVTDISSDNVMVFLSISAAALELEQRPR